MPKISLKKIPYSDIDKHLHANKSRYLNWILDSLLTSWHFKNQINRLCINFLQEAFENEQASIYLKKFRLGKYLVQGLCETDNKACFIAE